ncbi:MAG: NAD(P)/FAD-dependent oxidoreductase [Spirosomaceae bacterium]|jgi:hypothetical protein|nr:NAD(P)/FAD-dependent oxidoreductase [Spirosomataceae bacterium]
MSPHLIVIGGGAAGFMAAITAAESFADAKVTILEKNRTVLNKVRISGGGRCNVTNAAPTLPELLKGYPRGAKFLRPLFEQFDNHATVRWFENRGVALKTEPDGRIFPTTDDSQTIIDCLLQAATRAGVQVRCSAGVSALHPREGGFEVRLSNDEILHADRVIVTTGGHPQLSGYQWLADLGVQLVSPVPSLFTFNVPQSPLSELMGVAVAKVQVKIAGSKLSDTGAFLVTHWGVSGPAVLKMSAWGAREMAERDYQFTALVNFTDLKPAQLTETLAQHQKDPFWRGKFVATQPALGLPHRLWKKIITFAHIPDTMRWADLPAKNLHRLVENLSNLPLDVRGKTTFKEEFVTCGGVALSDVHAQTLESRAVPNLFFAGEVLDIDGITGGYNFQAAWTTGYIAGKSLSF